MPETYGVANFRRESLPIIPAQFQLIPRQTRVGKEQKADPGVLKQLKIIKEVFNQCDRIIVATDAGREGELIFRYIYQHIGCNKPFVRLWISSLTDKAIREGLEKLQPGDRYDNLYHSAQGRSEADWLIGINATQALSVAAGQGVVSLGRVQTPTLMMICYRYLENKNFTPTTFWQLKLTTQSNGVTFSAQSVAKYNQQAEAIATLQQVKDAEQTTVASVEKKESIQEPPLLYDLTALQKEANTKLNFSAEETASIPELNSGDTFTLSSVDLLEKQNKPKPLHNESGLLAEMENAGKELEDAELKASMRDAGIGTPATRAAIIETLFTRQYIVREKKSLVPTEKGLAVYQNVMDKKIADVEMTGMWENALSKIESGEMNAETIRSDIGIVVGHHKGTFAFMRPSAPMFKNVGIGICPHQERVGDIIFFYNQ